MDIVAELRALDLNLTDLEDHDWRDAADAALLMAATEIERLRAEIEVWRARLATQCGHTLAMQVLLNRELETNCKRDCPETL